mmetsp:Transcript_121988/g.352403  ORF Transcript_121988/g.352403 Transcript_121988/m.352403 type:complete len:430 (+) Transcript_121988:155-1444(+)|eukprot:CAMPEP_0176108760 /NCGR_PEP_ID=MMETSP0120_2-20121206/54601_1 /TAXON_ID=160619 /ORGANISM="Kryptoperidinium foliaceum, Strain CCMP 1326" /LENGTH=429 /DNA_ID=CAMNT_0017442935 /DNA_START=52 /DNA_END=1341 /DNA_ORIENTATION=-
MRLLRLAAATSAGATGAALVAAPSYTDGQLGSAPDVGDRRERPRTSLLARIRVAADVASSAARGSAAAPQVCRDEPPTWSDISGNTCKHYQEKEFCTPDGKPGKGWNKALYGSMGVWTLGGLSATSACCACGGGKQGEAPPCTEIKCPLGYSLMADAGKLFCKGFACNQDDDLETCCEASPVVKLAVDETKILIATLKKEVDQNITSAGQDAAKRATQSGGNFATSSSNKFKQDEADERKKVLSDAKLRFAKLTENTDNLPSSARHQITVSGYIAARKAVDSGAARIKSDLLKREALQVEDGFNSAGKVWDAANSTAHETLVSSARSWDKYHAGLNATWPVLVRSIQSINGAIELSEHPSQEVRWTEQATRIAADFSHIAETQVKSLSSQVAVVEERAQKALDLTVANQGRIANLQEMVDNALAGEPSR